MRKRAGTPRHHQPRIDSLEERTLLSTIVVYSEARPSRDAIFGKVQSIAPERWGGPTFGAAVQRPSPAGAFYTPYTVSNVTSQRPLSLETFYTPYTLSGATAQRASLAAASYTTSAPSGYVDKDGDVGKAEVYASAIPAFLSGSTALWGSGGQSNSGYFFNGGAFGVPRGLGPILRGAMTSSSSGESGDFAISTGPMLPAFMSMFMIGHPGPDGAYLSIPFKMISGLPFNPAARTSLELSTDDHGPSHDAQHDVFLPIGHVPGASDGTTTQPVGPMVDSREVPGLWANSGPGTAPATGRVVAALRESAPSFDLESALGRSLMPVSEVSISAVETISAMAVDAVIATEGALGTFVAGGNVSEPPSRGVVPQAEGEVPVPQGLGLIADLLPFDNQTVADAIDRFFDRFEDPDSSAGADADNDREPAALCPPPGALLLAVASVEVARRYFRRRREADAAARPGRRVVAGLGFDESFGSSGPWSSRLS